MPTILKCHWMTLTLLLGALYSAGAFAQEEDDDDELLAGLVTEYEIDGVKLGKIERDITLHPDSGQKRFGPIGDKSKELRAVWKGLLMSDAPGEYRLYVYGAGRITLRLANKTLLDQQSDRAVWMQAKSIELPFDWHPLEVTVGGPVDKAQVSLFWEGPEFAFEPIDARHLFHDPQSTSLKTPHQLQRGRRLVRALRCAACHEIPGEAEPPPAPALDRLTGNLHHRWLVEWLGRGQAAKPTGSPRRMPSFSMSEKEVRILADWLLSGPNRFGPPPPSDKKPAKKKTPKKQAKTKSKKGEKPRKQDGEELALTLGCLACHRVSTSAGPKRFWVGHNGLFDGGDLTSIAEKRPADFFARWLKNPSAVNRDHRMPVFDLTGPQRQALASYLAKQRGRNFSPVTTKHKKEKPKDLAAKAAQIAARFGCASCHRLPAISGKPNQPPAPVSRRRLSSRSNWNGSCLADPDAKNGLGNARPGYQLSRQDADAVRSYIEFASRAPAAISSRIDPAGLLVENNCLNCHARDGFAGLAPVAAAAAKARPSLAPQVPAMTPPSLVSVGDKLRIDALRDAIAREANHRPYLAVQMPKFRFSKQELESLAAYFVARDRIPPAAPHLEQKKESSAGREGGALAVAGVRLVTPSGFGCTSCHRVGKVAPVKAPVNARGPDLAMLEKRIRRGWFDRFVRNPARLVPHMEMPSIKTPVRGVLNDNLDDQLESVWQVLNRPGFTPPAPEPVRVVRQSGAPGDSPRAILLTDVLKTTGRTFIKPLLIALPNRHNVLLDLQTNRLSGWWIGDAAQQRTAGKSWYWEAGGADVLPKNSLGQALPFSDLTLILDGTEQQPLRHGQFRTEFDTIEHLNGGVAIRRRLHFRTQQGEPLALVVTETIRTAKQRRDRQESGFYRRIEVAGAPTEATVRFRPLVVQGLELSAASSDSRSIQAPGPGGTRIRIVDREEFQHDRFSFDEKGAIFDRKAAAEETITFEVAYITELPVDQYLVKVKPPAPPPAESLHVIPGFEATRLPLADEFMPTALAWRKDGGLIVASLKGRLWLASDKDGDGLEETMQPLADELAAPYGLAVNEDGAIDVINKYALLRLHDDNSDQRGRFPKIGRIETLASGWGHTVDYHDWAVGLPRDPQGNYYIALPCQQDQRPVTAARWRGHVLKLSPRQPTRDDPRRFAVEEISAGHRFPMGIAQNRGGQLFVTDNQGNYNPFNELNHVRPGARYGFINSLERRPGFSPPLSLPAIDIPHPWTRSVNGICFLETPPTVKAKRGAVFGPFEGHLLGCEYDTRRLIRMSLQKVGEVYQGAAYPFTFAQPRKGEPLLGPLACGVAPDGDLYIGCIRDSGWGGANNIGSLVRIRPSPPTASSNRPKTDGANWPPPGIAEVRASADGFVIEFTQPVDKTAAAKVDNYSLSSYTRISTPAYGGEDKDRRREKVLSVQPSADGRRVKLQLESWREGFVYEIRLKNLADPKNIGDKTFHPAEAYYTLRVAPQHLP